MIYSGISHIKSKKLHLLHENSIQDDPSRLIRCAKYASRIGFKISTKSLNQTQETIKKWPWQRSKKKERIIFPPAISIRIRMELNEIYKHDNLSQIIYLLNEWGTLAILNKNIQVDKQFLRGLHWLKKLNGNYILFLLKNSEDLENDYQRFFITNKEKKIIEDYLYIRKILEDKKEKYICFSPSDWTFFIEKEI